MKAKIKVEKEVDLKTLHVYAGVRYWEDTEVNAQPDTEEGDNIPCKEGDLWKPVIDIETGKIINWEQGKTANVHYKVCDDGVYYVKDSEGETVLTKEGYVPSTMCPEGGGYGDYIIMAIDENGFIKDWEFDLEDFQEEED